MKAQHSMVIVGPNAQVQNFKDTVGIAFGYGFGFGVGLRPDTPGSGPATHAGLHGWVSTDFKDFMEGTKTKTQDELDAINEAAGTSITQGDISSALASCTISFDRTETVGEDEVLMRPRAHFEAVLADAGLQKIPAEAV